MCGGVSFKVDIWDVSYSPIAIKIKTYLLV